MKLGEHSGTHFDAPALDHRQGLSGWRDRYHPRENFVAPVNVIDCSMEAAEDHDFLLTVDISRPGKPSTAHSPRRMGRDAHRLVQAQWFRADSSTPTYRTPHAGANGRSDRYIISTGAIGWGSETIGTDAGLAGGMTPPFPAHSLMHKSNRYGLASLCNLDRLPPKGAILIAAPLKIHNGTGSPTRVLALVPKT